MRKVNIGDLVGHVFSTRVGIILRIADDRRARSNRSFDVLWTNGKTGYNIWDYDLELLSENR
jgi:hypothetical protein